MLAPRKVPRRAAGEGLRLMSEIRQETGQKVGSISRVADRLGTHREALRDWVKRAEIDARQRPGASSSDTARIAELERKVKELERSDAILRAASVFFTPQLDPKPPGERVHRRVTGRPRAPCRSARLPNS
jgi:transposase